MDKDTLRKQIFQELQGQFETKLREAKRQKSQADEELETVSGKWRMERRKLNADIDRLESALTEAKEARKKTRDSKTHGMDLLEIAKIQASADEKIRTAAHASDIERGNLRMEISRLERAIAETLERSNNPIRATMGIRQQLEAQLEEVVKTKRSLEDEFLKAKESWDEEKLHLTGEIIKARRGAVKPLKGKQSDADRVVELENRVGEASRRSDGLERDFSKARDDWQSERQRFAAELDRIRKEAQQAESRAEDSTKRLEKQLREVSSTRDAFAHDLIKARDDWQSERHQLVTELDLARSRAQQILSQDNDQTTEFDRQLREVSTSRDALERDLAKARNDWHSERQQFVTELDQALGRAQTVQSRNNDQTAELERQLQQVSATRDALERDLIKARDDWRSERQQLNTELDQARSRNQPVGTDIDESATYGDQLREAMQQRNVLQYEVASARESIRAIRDEHADERRRMETRDQEVQDNASALALHIEHLERELAETQEAVNTEVVDQLRSQYDGRLQEMIDAKTQLTEDLKNVSALLEAEQARSAANGRSGPVDTDGIGRDKLNAELARVETLISDLAQLIGNPNTELSTVIRKNVERVELDAYLKGILFSMGRTNGL
jgi:DNA repair exonuclease SbcCD ATPase subunit